MARTADDTWDLASSVGATATMVAAARAMATNAADPVIDDPFAAPLVRAVGLDFFTKLVDDTFDVEALDEEAKTGLTRFANGMAARTRFFDDFFLDAGRAGIRQAVILASGLDSRAYRLRAGRLAQITRDHSLLQEQIDAGLITPEQAAFSANKNLVTRAVGVEDTVLLETRVHEVQPGDLYLLCSDGLSDMLDDAVLAQLLQMHGALAPTAALLVDAANDAGGKDNISLVLARAEGSPAAGQRSWWPFRR